MLAWAEDTARQEAARSLATAGGAGTSIYRDIARRMKWRRDGQVCWCRMASNCSYPCGPRRELRAITFKRPAAGAGRHERFIRAAVTALTASYCDLKRAGSLGDRARPMQPRLLF